MKLSGLLGFVIGEEINVSTKTSMTGDTETSVHEEASKLHCSPPSVPTSLVYADAFQITDGVVS